MSTFLQFIGLAAMVGAGWMHGRNIGIRIGAARYQDTVEEREERRAVSDTQPAIQRGVRLSSVVIRRD